MGPIIAGVVGSKKFTYNFVNIVSRMASTGAIARSTNYSGLYFFE